MSTFPLRVNEPISGREVLERIARGEQPVCGRCGAWILLVTTSEQARALGIPPGMQCSRDPGHYQVEFPVPEAALASSPSPSPSPKPRWTWRHEW